MKKTYEQPRVQHIGTVHELTLGSQDGDALDADFPDGTPRGDLGFS